jgi:hypothetical protein
MVVSNLTVFSQKGTGIDSNQICFPIIVAKQIAKDLMSGDSAKATLKLVEEQLQETENKMQLKDSTINVLKEKDENNKKIIDAERNKYAILQEHTNKVEKQLKKEKVKNKFKSVVSYGVIGIISFFLIIK